MFFLSGGIALGILIGWKIHEKRDNLKHVWESMSIVSKNHKNSSTSDSHESRNLLANDDEEEREREGENVSINSEIVDELA